MIGQSFVDNRNVSFFILTLPMIALSERFGLKEQAVILIKGMKKVTAPSFLFLYTVIRQVCGIFGIRISGMVQFVRPIVQPMSSAAAQEAGLATDAERGAHQGRGRQGGERRQLLRPERLRRCLRACC